MDSHGLVGAHGRIPASPPIRLPVNDDSMVLPNRDWLPKLKDFPAELGGSGEALPE